jgi:hypothetical protein
MKASVLTLATVLAVGVAGTAMATNVPQALPFSQNWSNVALIAVNDDWSGVPGVVGYRGDDAVAVTGVDPSTILADYSVVVDVNANQTNPNTFSTGGATEFDTLTDPVVALTGSGTADFPHLVFHVNTTGLQTITFACNLRDVDGSVDNSIQQIAVQYRVGNAGSWTNVAGGYTADASTGPSLAVAVTPVALVLPAAADNVPEVQIRVMTSNAIGNDEWIGVDDVVINGTSLPVATESTTWSNIKSKATN